MSVRILTGDCREVLGTLPDESVHCVVTSPPYWGLRDYGVEGIGLEPTLAEHIENMVGVFREVRRVLRKDGTVWLNYGDCYTSGGRDSFGTFQADTKQATHPAIKSAKRQPTPTGLKPKDLVMLPARIALALQADGWWLRSEIVWHKPNPMPESVTDRPTSAHEKIYLLTRSPRYFFDQEAVREPYAPATLERLNQATFDQQTGGPKDPQTGNRSMRRALVNLKGRVQGPQIEDDPDQYSMDGRNLRNVWTIATAPFSEAHFATFPPALIEPCIKAGCPKGGVVLDPFGGAGTTGLVADRLGRDTILIELNPEYAEMARRRLHDDAGMFAEIA